MSKTYPRDSEEKRENYDSDNLALVREEILETPELKQDYQHHSHHSQHLVF